MTAPSRNILRSGNPALRLALIAALAILLRAAVVWNDKVQYSDWQFGRHLFFTLPALELLALLLAVVPRMPFFGKRDGITRVGFIMLMVVMINAFLRIVDWLRMNKTCEGPAFYKYESLCEGTFVELFCNIPFLLIGGLVLWIWRANNN